MVRQLSGAAEAQVQAMHLNAQESKTIRSCIREYAMPASFGAKLEWMCYRVIQAVKSLFGCSDWQVANQIIRKRFQQMCIEKAPYLENPTTSQERFLKEHFSLEGPILSAHYAEASLSVALKAHQANAAITDRIRNEGLRQLDLDVLVSELIRETREAMTT